MRACNPFLIAVVTYSASRGRKIAMRCLSFAKTLQRHKSRPVTMLQARPHAIHFQRILDFGEGQVQM
jgi:hypothetical protein